jgi:hypothetical protein
MNIRPTSPDGPQRGTERLTDKTAASPAPAGGAQRVPAVPASLPDAVVLSQAARQLQAGVAGEPVPSGELSPDRLRRVLDRIQQGFYRTPEVERATLERLSADLRRLPEAQ